MVKRAPNNKKSHHRNENEIQQNERHSPATHSWSVPGIISGCAEILAIAAINYSSAENNLNKRYNSRLTPCENYPL